MASVTFRDETAMGRELGAFSLPGLPERISARELVRLRVREAVARHNAAPSHHFRGLVKPGDAEIDLTVDPVVSFVKLVPLVGG
ncbi:hypothetical protein ACIBI9_06675 [Nonomuraea sp. NPDC050451]|uniref:hypothetical protein n=1 Tax=Nonomuraea sp. NPDC050451 TaxID=3364364 RepID=UPI0037B2C86F